MTSDGELLRRYTDSHREDAFAELVRRHLDLVYSAALRQVNGDAHLAQDVAQLVFTDLARKASSLAGQQAITGWLYTGAHYAAAKAVRAERRRQTREQEAHAMQELLHDSEPNPDWESLRPVLDTAMHELNASDREVILMRYFENRPHADIGQQLGLSENTARMRIERALEKLRIILSRRGITTSAAALSIVLTANAVQAAPLGLSAAITAVAATTLATTATTTTLATATTMNWINIKSVAAIVAAALTAGTATHFVQQREANRLRDENQQLVTDRDKLTGERDAALAGGAADENELARLQKNQLELLRLRGEVGLLRGQIKDLEKLREENRRLQEGLAKAGQSSESAEVEPETDPQRQVAIAKMGLAKELVLGLLVHAQDNQEQFPTDFGQVLSVLKKDPADLELRPQVSAILKSPYPNSTMLNQFEIVTPPSMKSVTNWAMTIAIREKEPWLLNGKRVKVYGYLDGHSETHTEPPEGFAAWEKQHMVR